MRRKQKTLFFILACLPFTILIPILLCIFIPNYLIWFYRLCYLAPIVLITYFFLPSSKQIIFTSNSKPLTTGPWILTIFIIQLICYLVFLGQLNLIGQYELKADQLTTSQYSYWLTQQAHHLFANWGLFPWAFILIAMVIFYRTRQRHNVPQHLTACLPLPHNLTGNLTRRLGDLYIGQATRCIIALIIGMLATQLSLLIYPAFSAILLPLPGVTACFITLVIGNLKKFDQIFNMVQAKKPAPFKFLLVQLFFLILIISLSSFLIYKFSLPKNDKLIAAWTPFKIYAAHFFPALDKLYLIGWWVIATPFISSLITYYSTGKSLRITILINLIIPLIMLWITLGNQSFLITFLTQNHLLYFSQIFPLIGLLVLFKSPSSNQIFWFGYMPTKPMSKLRVINPKLLWLLAPALLGLFSLTGIQGFVLASSLAVIPLIILYALLII